MSQKPPAFQLYPRNWLTSRNVIRMSRGARADYLHLLCHAWLSEIPGTLPYPIEDAAREVGWKASKLRHFLAQFPTTFELKKEHNSDLLVNSFLYPQWIKYQEISEKRRQAASKSSAIASHAGGSASASSPAIKTTTKPAAKPAPPADVRFQPFLDFVHESYTAKHRAEPLWQGKDYKALRTLLRSYSSEALPLKRLETLWQHFAASTEPFTARQGDSLAYFCGNLGKFSDGPILAAPRNGNGSPKEAEAFREAQVGAGPELPAPRMCVCGKTGSWHLNAAKRGHVVDHEFTEVTA